MGLEPGVALADLERRILAADEDLAPPAPPEPPRIPTPAPVAAAPTPPPVRTGPPKTGIEVWGGRPGVPMPTPEAVRRIDTAITRARPKSLR